MIRIIVTNYELQSEKITVHLSDGKYDCEYALNRQEYEDWLTGGTGMVDMSFTHHYGGVITEVEIKEPIADYWLQGEEINNSPILEHLQLYVTRDELSRTLARMEILEQHLKDLFDTHIEGLPRTEGYASLVEYGMLAKEAGEQMAGAMYKKILTSRTI
jgi:hypothetical protein